MATSQVKKVNEVNFISLKSPVANIPVWTVPDYRLPCHYLLFPKLFTLRSK